MLVLLTEMFPVGGGGPWATVAEGPRPGPVFMRGLCCFDQRERREGRGMSSFGRGREEFENR